MAKRKPSRKMQERNAAIVARWDELAQWRKKVLARAAAVGAPPYPPDLQAFYRFQRAYPPVSALDGLERFLLQWPVGMRLSSNTLYGNGKLLGHGSDAVKEAICQLERSGWLSRLGKMNWELVAKAPSVEVELPAAPPAGSSPGLSGNVPPAEEGQDSVICQEIPLPGAPPAAPSVVEDRALPARK